MRKYGMYLYNLAPISLFVVVCSSLNLAMNHLIIFRCIFQLFLVFSATNAYKITFKTPNPVSMGSNGPIKIKVVMDSYKEEDNWIESNLVRLEFNLTNQKSWLLEIQNQSLGKANYFSDRHF